MLPPAKRLPNQIKVDAPGVAAPFGEQVQTFWCADDIATRPAEIRCLECPPSPCCPARRRANRQAPGQRIGKRVRVFHAEPRKENFRIAVGNVVLITVGVEQQIRRLYDEHPAVAQRHSRRQIQIGKEVFYCVSARPSPLVSS